MVFPLTSNLTAGEKAANVKKKREKQSRKSLVIFDDTVFQLCSGFCSSHFLLITTDNVTLDFLRHHKRTCKSSLTVLTLG